MAEEIYVFNPPRRNGIILHSILISLLLSSGTWLIWFSTKPAAGRYYLLFTLFALAFYAPLVPLVYRLLCLIMASYTLERNGLRLRWGLRAEDIPLEQVEWIRLVDELDLRLPLPRFSFPGAILGGLNVEGLGRVEFLASQSNRILLVATPEKIFAISPEDQYTFLSAFQRSIELGSLYQIPTVSVLPVVYLRQVWDDSLARGMILSGLILSLGVFFMAALILPGNPQQAAVITEKGAFTLPKPGDYTLLPILGSLTYVFNLFVGLFFYRLQHRKTIAYLLWISSVSTCALLLAAIFLILG